MAAKEASRLVAHLQSLKQIGLPNGTVPAGNLTVFLYQRKLKNGIKKTIVITDTDDAALYATHWQACHQANVEGLKGAFPARNSSEIVTSGNPELMLNIIMNGYDAGEEFGIMPAVGKNADLKPDEIAGIMRHEKNPRGNNVVKVNAEKVKKLMEGMAENAFVDWIVPLMINAYGKGDQKRFLITDSETPQSIPALFWILLIGFESCSLYYLITHLSLTE